MPTPQHPTLRQALTTARHRLEAASIADASLEAEVLLRHALSAHPEALEGRAGSPQPTAVSRPVLYIHLDDPLPDAAAARLDAYLARRIAREPTAYITGHREFYNLDLQVTPATLIPRPDTETLVEVALELAKRLPSAHPEAPDGGAERAGFPHSAHPEALEGPEPVEGQLKPGAGTTPSSQGTTWEPSSPSPKSERGPGGEVAPTPPPTPILNSNNFPMEHSPSPPAGRGPGGGVSIADIGTGSGTIALALATALPHARIHATDSSPAALAVAEANARRHNLLERVDFHLGDLLAPLEQPVDLIVANLPYVATADYLALEPEVRDHEPRAALDGGPDGLDVIRRLLLEAPHHLAAHGAIALEFGLDQATPLEALARQTFPTANIRIHPDLAGRPRVISIALP